VALTEWMGWAPPTGGSESEGCCLAAHQRKARVSLLPSRPNPEMARSEPVLEYWIEKESLSPKLW